MAKFVKKPRNEGRVSSHYNKKMHANSQKQTMK